MTLTNWLLACYVFWNLDPSQRSLTEINKSIMSAAGKTDPTPPVVAAADPANSDAKKDGHDYGDKAASTWDSAAIEFLASQRQKHESDAASMDSAASAFLASQRNMYDCYQQTSLIRSLYLDVDIPSDFADSCTVRRCALCNADDHFPSEAAARSHYVGPSHRTRARAWLAEWSARTGMPAPRMAGDEDMTNMAFCEVCRISLSSAIVAKDHYAGKVHAKNLRKLGIAVDVSRKRKPDDGGAAGEPQAKRPKAAADGDEANDLLAPMATVANKAESTKHVGTMQRGKHANCKHLRFSTNYLYHSKHRVSFLLLRSVQGGLLESSGPRRSRGGQEPPEACGATATRSHRRTWPIPLRYLRHRDH